MTNHRFFTAILLVYLFLSGSYNIVNPLFESPDEIWHYEYVRWLVEGNGLAEPDDVGHAPWHQEGSQPPLYYIAAAALTAWVPTDNAPNVIRYNPHAAIGHAESFGNKNMMVHSDAERWPWSGVVLAAHLARFFSMVLGAITVWATYSTARLLSPQNRWVALLAASIVAFNPQFLFLSAAVNNDNLVMCVSAVGVWYGLRLTRRAFDLKPESGYNGPTAMEVAIFGVIAGVAALSKLSGLLLSLYVAMTFGVIAWQRRSLRSFLRWGLISGIAMVTVSGWWYLRNWLLFGDPLALQAMFDILPRRGEPPTWAELVARSEGVWHSLWAVFGWFNVVVAPVIYRFYSTLALIGMVGFGIYLLARMRSPMANSMEKQGANPKGSRVSWFQILLITTWIVILVLSLWRWAQMRYPQGRLLFPAMSALATVLAIGLNQWIPAKVPRGVMATCNLLIIGIMFAIAAISPWYYIAPSYRPVAAFAPKSSADPVVLDNNASKSTDATEKEIESSFLPLSISFSALLASSPSNDFLPNFPSPDSVIMEPSLPESEFGGQIQLVSATLGSDEPVPGGRLPLALTWRTNSQLERNFSIFVHLVDENNIVQAQNDSYPGQGNQPTSEWNPGEFVYDMHLIDIPTTVPTPATLKVNLGIYDFETGERLLINDLDHWTLGLINLAPPPGDGTLPNSTFVNFEDKIGLVGYELDRYTMSPGETLTLTLWWEALDAPLRDTKVYAHLVFPPEATWAQDDDRPRSGTAKTDTWNLGDRIEDEYQMTLPEGAPLGVYLVRIGLYDGETYKRLKVNFSDHGTVIGKVRVTQ